MQLATPAPFGSAVLFLVAFSFFFSPSLSGSLCMPYSNSSGFCASSLSGCNRYYDGENGQGYNDSQIDVLAEAYYNVLRAQTQVGSEQGFSFTLFFLRFHFSSCTLVFFRSFLIMSTSLYSMLRASAHLCASISVFRPYLCWLTVWLCLSSLSCSLTPTIVVILLPMPLPVTTTYLLVFLLRIMQHVKILSCLLRAIPL